ncbi:MAG TPA: hypothetical protein VGG33_25140, partial [Polyangia bacterium]
VAGGGAGGARPGPRGGVVVGSWGALRAECEIMKCVARNRGKGGVADVPVGTWFRRAGGAVILRMSLVVAGVFAVQGPARALACSFATQTSPPQGAPRIFEEEISGPLVVGTVDVKRGNEAACSPCLGGTGIITLPLGLPATSRQSICRLTLSIAVTAGQLPRGFAPLAPRAGLDCRQSLPSPALVLAWADENEAFGFDMSVALTDETEKQGPPVIVRIEHAGGVERMACGGNAVERLAGGCSHVGTSADARSIPMAAALLFFLLVIRRWPSPVNARRRARSGSGPRHRCGPPWSPGGPRTPTGS